MVRVCLKGVFGMKVKYITSIAISLVCFLVLFNFNTYALYSNGSLNEEKDVSLNIAVPSDNISPQYYEHTLFTTINSNNYTKIESSGNYARSNAIKVEYISTESNSDKCVRFIVEEHMAFTADKVYEFELSVDGEHIVHLKKTGNNFTIKAMLVDPGIETIETKTTLYRDTTV